MKSTIVSFGSEEFFPSLDRLLNSALKFGVDEARFTKPEHLVESPFFHQNLDIFQHRRGYGYWLWKPFLILAALRDAAENDIVIYSDAGVEIVASLAPLIALARDVQPLVAFGNGNHKNSMWTKRDCFILLQCDSAKFWEAAQWNGFFQVYRRCDFTIQFVEEWLSACCDARILTDIPNEMGQPNLPDFRDHRHDQSVLSLISEKRGIQKFRDPSQWGNYLKIEQHRTPGEYLEHSYEEPGMVNSPYGTLLNHHRTRSVRVEG
jgi:hypothetical protein